MGDGRICACEGQNLDRLLQPTVLSLLAGGPQHGYALLEQLKASPLLRGAKPDATGVYRLLNGLEEQGLASCNVAESEAGPAKRVYRLTKAGRVCLKRWIETLEQYQRAISELLVELRARDV